jgi:hypothetical protein
MIGLALNPGMLAEAGIGTFRTLPDLADEVRSL